MNDIGIYVLTYPGDYYLSKPLIESLRRFAPSIPVMIIPGEGLDREDHPFDVPIMPHPGGFWGEIGHADRKFWSFQGPFEKFVYLDADIICSRNLDRLFKQLEQQDGNFLNLQLPYDDETWRSAITDTNHILHNTFIRRINSQLGDINLLHEFDPDYDPFGHYPFNDGLFASSRYTIDEQAFKDLNDRERMFFKQRLKKDFSWKSFDLFFGDQGRMNYLVDRLGLKRLSLFPYGNYQWGGNIVEIRLEEVLSGSAQCNFIHWAGCPRPNPSLFCKAPLLRFLTLAYPDLPNEYSSLNEIPGYSVWWYFSGPDQKKWKTAKEILKWTRRDAKLIARKFAHGFGKKLKS